jgi:hypothetical protein
VENEGFKDISRNLIKRYECISRPSNGKRTDDLEDKLFFFEEEEQKN